MSCCPGLDPYLVAINGPVAPGAGQSGGGRSSVPCTGVVLSPLPGSATSLRYSEGSGLPDGKPIILLWNIPKWVSTPLSREPLHRKCGTCASVLEVLYLGIISNRNHGGRDDSLLCLGQI